MASAQGVQVATMFRESVAPSNGIQSSGRRTQDFKKYMDNTSTKDNQIKNEPKIMGPKNFQKDNPINKTKSTESTPIADKIESLTDNDKVEKAITEIVDVLKEELNLTKEEMADIMAMLGMQWTDLLKPDQVTKFIMQQTAVSNEVELLTNGSVSDIFKNVMNQIDQIKEDNQLQNINLSDLDLEEMNEQFTLKLEEVLPQEIALIKPETDTSNMETQALPAEELHNKEEAVHKTRDLNQLQGQEGPQVTLKDQSTHLNDPRQGRGQKDQGTEKSSVGQNVVNQLNDAVGKTSIFKEAMNASTEVEPIVTQVVDQIKQIHVVMKNNSTSMELQLNPEHLGKVNIQVASKDGIITAVITTQTEAAKKAMESQMDLLKQTFISKEIKVEAVEVRVATQGFQQNMGQNGQAFSGEQQNGSKRKQINLKDLSMLNGELTQEETMTTDLMEQNGNSVDYTA